MSALTLFYSPPSFFDQFKNVLRNHYSSPWFSSVVARPDQLTEKYMVRATAKCGWWLIA